MFVGHLICISLDLSHWWTDQWNGVRSVHLIPKGPRKRADAWKTSNLLHSVRKEFCFSSWRNPPCKAGNEKQMFRCHQNLMCPMDVLAITGKQFKRQFQKYRAASRYIMSFKALSFWQLSGKTRWTYLMDSSSSKKLTHSTSFHRRASKWIRSRLKPPRLKPSPIFQDRPTFRSCDDS